MGFYQKTMLSEDLGQAVQTGAGRGRPRGSRSSPQWLRSLVPVIERQVWPVAPVAFELPRFGRMLGAGVPDGAKKAVREGYQFQLDMTRKFLRDVPDTVAVLPEQELFYWKWGREYRLMIDILIMDPRKGVAIVVECKRTHTAKSFDQLWLYMAVVQDILGEDWKVAGFELCKKEGLSMDYPGVCEWLMLEEINVGPFLWTGEAPPYVGIIPMWQGLDWELHWG